MEKQRNINATAARSFHLATLSRQNFSDACRDLGGLDSVDGDHLFPAARVAISDVRSRAFFLGLTPDLHDESIRRKNFCGRAARARDRRPVAAVYYRRSDKSA